VTPKEAVTAFQRLGCTLNPKHSRKNYAWLELLNEHGHQIAIFNVPTSKNPVRRGTLINSLLNPNGIEDEAHLKRLLDSPDPPAAFRAVLPAAGPRYRPHGQ
jgi:hypothetical protein